jgi:hypothetical protein
MFCSECGKEITDNSKFCAECGENLSDEITQNDSEEERFWSFLRLKDIMIIVITLAVLILIGVVYFFNTRESTVTREWKEAYKSNFMYSCTDTSGGLIEGCSCVADKLIKNHSVPELIKFDTEFYADFTINTMDKYAEECR